MNKRKSTQPQKTIPLWIKPGIPIWLENKEQKTNEIIDYKKGFVSQIEGNQIKVDIPADKKQQLVEIEQIHERQLEHHQVKDLVEIPLLNDAELMAYFNLLYIEDTINVYCGPSLIVINPNKRIPKEVSPQTLALIQSCYEKKQLDSAPPHVWRVAGTALELLKTTRMNQAICINGESGAGKTVATKLALQFLTSLDSKKFEMKGEDLASMIMACNPILEAFGNAKTNRNDNSSRFGKYVKLFYDLDQDLKILGATTENYLLEKIRVVDPSKNERSFHIFYAMLHYMTPNQLQKYYLNNKGNSCDPSLFKILKKSGIYKSEKIDDKEFFEEVEFAFERLHFTQDEIDAIWRIVSAVLYLGNLEVDKSKYIQGQIPCSIVKDENWKKLIKLLEIDEKLLEESLIAKKRKLGGNIISTPYTPENVSAYILSIGKDLYEKMFNWIVKKMNIILKGSLDIKYIENITEPLPDNIRTIGILDIFGFEIFDNNYLEQLFINYANERLQGLYIDHIFKNEVKFFKAEGLEKHIDNIKYEDNIGLINILDSNKGQVGIFPMVNEISQMNKTDSDLIEKMRNNFQKNGKEHVTFHKMKKQLFYVKHTARDVEYNINGFIDKNKDEISKDATKAIYSCKNSILKIYQQIIDEKDAQIFDSQIASKSSKEKFMGYKFTQNMNQLIYQLTNSNCHFIRCVKPNEEKKENHWVAQLVLKQITYMGVLNSLLIRKKNYVFRFDFKEFYMKYQDLDLNKEGSISIVKLQSMNPDWEQLSKNLLDSLEIKPTDKDLLIGKTKILIQEKFKHILDDVLKKKQIKKREALAKITILYKDHLSQQKVKKFFVNMQRSLEIAKGVLTGIKAKVDYVNFKHKMKTVRQVQIQFKKIQQQRRNNLKRFKIIFLMKYFKMHQLQESILKILSVQKIFYFVGIRLRYLLYQARKRICRRIVDNIFDKSWIKIKSFNLDNSCFDIQRTYRAFLLRQNYRDQVDQLDQKVKEIMEYNAIVKLQANSRRYLVLRRMERLKIAASKIQRFFKTYWLSTYFKKMVKSAIIIQRFVRKHLYKKLMIREQFQKVITNSGKTLSQVVKSEYSFLFGQKSFYDGSKSDIYYNNYLSRNDFFKKKSENLIPKLHTVNLQKKARIFSLVIDFSTKSDTGDIYNKSWAHSFWNLFEQIQEQEECIIGIEISEHSTFLITDKLRVFSWGTNFHNVLCRKTDFKYCQDAEEITNLSRNKVKNLKMGKDQGIMLCQNGEILSWGNQQNHDYKDRTQFIQVDNNQDRIIDIIFQNKKSFVLNEQGLVYEWPQKKYDFTSQKQFSFQKNITQISAGTNFMIMIEDDQIIYSYGQNEMGQLGLGDNEDRIKPQKILFKYSEQTKIKEISCGYKHVLLRTSMGMVYSWGDNSLYQLGQQTDKPFINKPQKISFSKISKFRLSMKSIAAGNFCSYFLEKNNHLYFCGESGMGIFYNINRLPYQEKYFDLKMGDKFVPLKLKSSWSKTKSVIYLQFLDFRESSVTQSLVKQKIGKLLLDEWSKNNILPYHSDYLLNFIQSKNFFQYENRGLCDATLNQSMVSTRQMMRQQNESKIEENQKQQKSIHYDMYEEYQQFPIQNILVNEKNSIIETNEQKITKNKLKKIEQKHQQEKDLYQKNEKLLSILKDKQEMVDEIQEKNKRKTLFKGNQNVRETSFIDQSFGKQKKSISQKKEKKNQGYKKSIFIEPKKPQKQPSNIQDKKILNKVNQIMKKDPKTWTKVQRDLVNNYIKLTEGFFQK